MYPAYIPLMTRLSSACEIPAADNRRYTSILPADNQRNLTRLSLKPDTRIQYFIYEIFIYQLIPCGE